MTNYTCIYMYYIYKYILIYIYVLLMDASHISKRITCKNWKNQWKWLILREKILIYSERLEGFQWNFQERCGLW